MALVVKNPLASAGDIRNTGLILGWENALEEGMAIHSSILAWRIPWTEEAGGAWFIETQKSRSQLKQLSMHAHKNDNKNPQFVKLLLSLNKIKHVKKNKIKHVKSLVQSLAQSK